jgi:prepilin-type N-terminal cleavage/methylation domain-containing protein
MKTTASSRNAFTLVEIMIVVAIIGFLMAIAVPNFIRTRSTSQMKACIDNLRQIDGAAQQWALENKKSPNAPVTLSDIRDFLRGPLTCPAGGTSFGDSYQMTTVTNKPVCRRQPTGSFPHVLPPETSN